MSFEVLTSVSKAAYSKVNWHIMASAYEQATFMLDASDGQPQNTGRLAREVMRLFNNGKRDVSLIASLAADRERTMGFSAEMQQQTSRTRSGVRE
ncbi:hypothetical protein [Phyllobacterium chamaecytisi]|uniref:hypothetical protein n=1 Tax=Phyllobacterium chamaecytisi TaxID=2876082 RepID=UPI001CCA9417|nr:hypothetical protein [Phyllobacterium sp. KW56]MBZ9603328.1 hypothetical protein [Phyllobacterium sp. KW56]